MLKENFFEETECIITDTEIYFIFYVKFFEVYIHQNEEYALMGRIYIVRIPYKIITKEEELMNILRKKLEF
ncbi:MAG: hypothetical protein QXG00_01430 [Candidatus Woesearchaeota archaeon]